ncbi:hypothetical protein EYF80_054836 [Liparis tanakae]|uniref:Uncharacterized protein n=1 Tax=Liparis tanakae TaxID=230148 RepID=A0A4Z2F2M0_9TELE|nr:hypothetical protein EYF80_054836 [Liparis tanakae]
MTAVFKTASLAFRHRNLKMIWIERLQGVDVEPPPGERLADPVGIDPVPADPQFQDLTSEWTTKSHLADGSENAL